MSESEPLVEPSKLVFLLAEAIIIHDTMTEAACAYPPGSQERRNAYERFYGEAREWDHLKHHVGEALAEAAQNGTLGSLDGKIQRLQKATAKLASVCVDAEWPRGPIGPVLEYDEAYREVEFFILASFGGDDDGRVPTTNPDALVTLSQVAPLTGLSKRTLERYLKDGKMPEPDYRGGGGKAHKWLWQNLRLALAKIVRRELPKTFPGSRII